MPYGVNKGGGGKLFSVEKNSFRRGLSRVNCPLKEVGRSKPHGEGRSIIVL
jgi:hypothetical protein